MKQTENQRIKAFREALLLTQTQFAKCLDSSGSTVAKIEGGAEATEKFISKLSTALNANAEWIKTNKGQMFISGTLQENIELAKLFLKNNGTVAANPWQDEAYKQVKEENLTLRQQLDKLTQALLNLSVRGNPNFLKASDVAEIPKILKGIYSGAYAQQTGATA